ncbi:MAG: DUF975 family protein [Clostridia bacterium]
MTWTKRRRDAKRTAKISLAGSWLRGIWIAMIYFLASLLTLGFVPINIPNPLPDLNKIETAQLLRMFLPDTITTEYLLLIAVSIVLFLIVLSPLAVGISRFFLRVARGEKPKFSVAFESFLSLKQVAGSVVLAILTFVLRILWCGLLLAVPIGLVVFAPTLGPLATVFALPLYIIAMFGIFVAIAPYSLASFMYAQAPERGAFRSILAAVKCCKGHRIEFMIYQMSFLPWRVLAFITAPIGSSLFMPYEQTATALFMDSIVTPQNDLQ